MNKLFLAIWILYLMLCMWANFTGVEANWIMVFAPTLTLITVMIGDL